MKLLTLITLLFACFYGTAQTQFWSDNFEDAGAPSSGTRTPSVQNAWPGSPPYSRYFSRVSVSDLLLQNGTYSGFQGSKFWAGEDIDAALTGTNFGQSATQTISWNSINISGKSGLIFKGYFACDNVPNVWERGLNDPANPADYMIISYQIDGGAWVDGVRIFATATGQFAPETTGDSIGDGTILTSYAFTEFTANIVGTGTTLNLKFKCYANGGTTEELAIDDFRLFETPACTAPTITGNPPNRSICVNGNTTFSSTATGATAYQWQVNTGSGFTDISNGGVYSNATTNTLTITGAIAGMNGYLYRCTAINGVASCFTNSNAGTLNISNITSSTAQNNVACFGTSTGSAAVSPVGGIGSYTYSWSPSGGIASIATGLAAGSYTVTITDAIACQITKNFTLTQPPVLNGSTVVTNIACFGGNTGAINLTPSGGTPGYTFNWNSGVATTEDRTTLTAGTYSVVITDANNCQRTVSGITVTQPTAVVSGTTTVTNTTCNSANNGVIDFTPTGGTGPYTYNWGGGITSQDRISLAAGTYSVTITDANACTGTVSGITVTQPTAVSGGTTITNTSCNGGTNGTIDFTPSGGTPGYTYSWGGGITSQDRTALAAGSYSVTITDANGCTGTVNATVTQPTAVSGVTTVTNVACFGNSTGAINLTPTGGTPGYTFNWNSGVATTEDRTSLTAGTYSVTITDANGCTGTISPMVTQPAAVVSGTTVVTNVACFGNNTGAINLTPTGGVGPYTFNWVGGATTEDRTLLSAGTYSVTITDANACTGTVSGITVTQPAAVVSGTRVVTNVSCFGGNNGAINLTPTGGVGPYTFNWVGGATTEDRTSLTAGTYSVTITDANACTGTVSGITVTQPAATVSGTTIVTNVACNGANTGSINLTPTGGTGPYTQNWVGGITTEDRTVLTAGTYSVTITDFNGCTGTVNATVTQPTAISVTAASQTNVSCNGGSNGAAAINTPTGGVSPYTYNWTPGNPTGDGTVSVTGLSAGTYTVTVTDDNACTASQSFTVTQPTALSVMAASQTNVACFGGSNGAAAINTPTGGTPGYTYDWTPGTPTGDGTVSVNGLTAGTWTVNVTDANGCVASQNFTVTQPTAISVTAASQTNVACNGGSNGAAAINTPTGGTPGYTYDWTPGTPTGDGTTSVNGLTAGTWTVNVTDANGCVASQSFTVTQPTAISFTAASQTNIACFGDATGAFAVNTPTGGTGAFTYDWAPGTPTGDGTTSVTGLTAGTYSVTTTDNNGCTASISFTITEPPVLVVSAGGQTNVSCNGGSNASATVTVSGGTPGYSYLWSPTGGANATASGLTAGTYTVTVTDANGCQATQTFTITEPTVLDASSGSQVDVLCNGGSTGSATVIPTGGTGTYDYSWAPTGGTAATASGLVAGTYTVTVTDDNSCQATKTFVITQSAALTSSFSHSACNSYTWGTQTHTVSGTYTQTFTAANACDSVVTLTLSIVSEITNTVTESSCVSYTWAQNNMTYTASGLYVDTIPAFGGCDSIVTLDLTINTPSGSSSSEFACGTYTWAQNGMTYTASGAYTDTIPNANGCDSIITLNLTIGGSSASESVTVCESYTWAQTGLEYTATGMYADTLTDANGCDSILVLNLTVNSNPTATATDNGNATITASAGTTYQWINCTTNTPISGATAQTFMATANGTYAVIVTNATNCSDTSDCVVIDNVGLDEKNTSFGVTLTPNPTQNNVQVTFTGANEASIVIYDVKGKMVLSVDHAQTGEVLSVEAFERGVYLVNITTSFGKHTERLVKQ
ncbi:T9SS type A sorting domain-containing protein [Fluviicola taffensis]|nr:T9SS type A sorting domain-containing protein [Fluviicola taffensis]